jgi:hypothetical protein
LGAGRAIAYKNLIKPLAYFNTFANERRKKALKVKRAFVGN